MDTSGTNPGLLTAHHPDNNLSTIQVSLQAQGVHIDSVPGMFHPCISFTSTALEGNVPQAIRRHRYFVFTSIGPFAKTNLLGFVPFP